MSSLARIDSHHHLWRYDPAALPWIDDAMPQLKRDFLPPDPTATLSARGYTGAVAVQAQLNTDETVWLLDLADATPLIKGVVGWVDLCAVDVARALAALAARKKLKGIRHVVQAEPDDEFMLRPDFQRGIAALEPLGLTYDILIFERQLPAAIKLCERFGSQKFVLDHIGKPTIKAGAREPWARNVRALARHANTFCKVSGMVTEADWKTWKKDDLRFYLDVVFDAFGPERLMIGSDWPVCLLAGDYSRVMAVVEDYLAALPAAAADAVLGQTAERFYSL